MGATSVRTLKELVKATIRLQDSKELIIATIEIIIVMNCK